MDLFDLIGPVMIGPSSSHTAGAARIGRVTRMLLGEDVKKAEIYFHGSFAKTWEGHGADRAVIGGLLGLGIGDTLRVTLTADPVEEIVAAKDILKAVGLRKDGPDLIACPTCGRTKIDLIGLVNRVDEALKNCDKPITVAVMGCVVNGPGEARECDFGIAGGKGEAVLFEKGQVVCKISQDAIIPTLLEKLKQYKA